jgi:hypothetical protein
MSRRAIRLWRSVLQAVDQKRIGLREMTRPEESVETALILAKRTGARVTESATSGHVNGTTRILIEGGSESTRKSVMVTEESLINDRNPLET